MQVILDSSFARPGSAPIWGGKKVEFRDWTTLYTAAAPAVRAAVPPKRQGNAPVNVNPRTSGRDIAGHLRRIFLYLTSERAADIGDFDLFCTSSKNSGGVDRAIFHRGRLGQETLVRKDGGF